MPKICVEAKGALEILIKEPLPCRWKQLKPAVLNTEFQPRKVLILYTKCGGNIVLESNFEHIYRSF